MTFKIRRTIEDDVSELTRIVSENYSRSFAEYFVPEVETTFSHYAWKPHFYTAEHADLGVVGCAAFVANWISWGTYSLSWVNTDKRVRNRGIGKALVDQCLREISFQGTLVVLSTSVPEFYSKNWGFQLVQDFVGNEGDAYQLMTLALSA